MNMNDDIYAILKHIFTTISIVCTIIVILMLYPIGKMDGEIEGLKKLIEYQQKISECYK